MEELLKGLLSPAQMEQTESNARIQGLMALGNALMQAGAPRAQRTSTFQGLGMAAPAYMQGRQQAFDQTLQDILRQTQVQDLLRQRQEQEMAKRRQAQVQQMIPNLYRERMGQVPTTIPTETYENVQTTVPGVVGAQLDPERLRMLGMLGPEGMQAATQLAQFERSMQAPARQTVTAKPGERVIDPMTGEVVAEVPTAQREVKTKTIDVGNKILVVDEANPGQILASYPKARDTAPKDVSGTEITVGKNFEASVQPYVGITQAYKKVEAAANDPSAAGDLSLIFGFMKILDPASVVRETEFANAQNAAGVPDQIRNQYNKILNGERLNPNQRTDFIRQARELAKSQKSVFEGTIMPRYESIVATNNLNRANVLFDPFAGIDFNKPLEKPKAPSAANKPTLPGADIDLINKYLKRGQ
jgi:hypothetical protein